MQGNNQELWAIGYKVVLSLFMITLMTLESMALSPWYILVVLLFFCLNLSVFLLKNKLMKQGVLLLSLLLLLISSYLIDPLFMLLFPINVYEWMGYHTKKSIIGLIPAAIPVLFLPAETYLPMASLPWSVSCSMPCSPNICVESPTAAKKSTRCGNGWIP
ncbi:hypothetical protein [Paenibacillus sp. JCM 10914]|uniref:hypothetical protein n=1 Tax=Paenibacillus sp. JCM 10914 TaxID=1236974 RepID=UPI0003CCAB23|nr:hypothetical protein [Paenibacillus sp. JCM 10914]GAE06986.1 hypothetical protein JCM10914_3187 [Paenibacillus sp. JCM 10914]